MELLDKLLNFADEFDMLPETGTVLCCVSGGADSMCLLDALLHIAPARGFTVAAAHFNHRLRGAESDRDEMFTRDYCTARGVPFYSACGDVNAYAREHGLGIEEAARDCRYAFFHKTAQTINACRIATAHTADDNAETMLMNFTRGAGTLGLCGIPPVRGIIIRPMLRISKAQVVAWNEERGVPCVEDSTNSLDIYTRNKIRHVVMPVLQELNPRFDDAVSTSAELLRIDEEYLSELAEEFVRVNCARNTASAAELSALPKAVSTRVVRKLCFGSLSYKHVNAVLELCRSGGVSGSLSLPGMTVRREYDTIVFGAGEQPDGFAPITPVPGQTAIIPGLSLKMSCKSVVCSANIIKINKSLTSFYFKSNDLCGNIIVRPRREGDEIRLSGQRKSLKKLFIEHRIPRVKRGLVPVVADDEGVLAVYGIGIGQRAVPQPGDTALQIDFEKENEGGME